MLSVVSVQCGPVSDKNIRFRGRKFIIITIFVETKLTVSQIDSSLFLFVMYFSCNFVFVYSFMRGFFY